MTVKVVPSRLSHRHKRVCKSVDVLTDILMIVDTLRAVLMTILMKVDVLTAV